MSATSLAGAPLSRGPSAPHHLSPCTSAAHQADEFPAHAHYSFDPHLGRCLGRSRHHQHAALVPPRPLPPPVARPPAVPPRRAPSRLCQLGRALPRHPRLVPDDHRRGAHPRHEEVRRASAPSSSTLPARPLSSDALFARPQSFLAVTTFLSVLGTFAALVAGSIVTRGRFNVIPSGPFAVTFAILCAPLSGPASPPRTSH